MLYGDHNANLFLCKMVIGAMAMAAAALSTSQRIAIELYSRVRLRGIEVCAVERHGQRGERRLRICRSSSGRAGVA